MINPVIFRAYDIRGKAHSQINEEACLLIGHAFGTVLRRLYKKDHPTVIVGRDARTHSPQFEKAMIEGLKKSGCEIWKIGQTPSPLNYFTICDRQTDGGVQITASHNPKDDNGIKLQVRDAEAWSGEQLQELRQQIEKKDFLNGEGSEKEIDGTGAYIDHLARIFGEAGKNLKIVVDCGNGVTGPVNVAALEKIGATVIGMYTEPDGEFPNHPADPSKHATLVELQARVKKEKAHLGIAFDGDGDRMGLVDETGTIRSADEILLLLAKDHLSRTKNVPIVFTVSNSEILNTEIVRYGGKPVMVKVGHSFVEHAMREEGAMLGGEQSGHYFCAEDYYGFDDALVAAMRILSIVQAGKKPVSEHFAEFPKVYQAHELRPHCPDEKKTAVIASVTKFFEKTHKVITLDGVRIDFGDGAWAGIRQSNTSPCISICMEARSPEKLKEVEETVLGHLKTYPDITFE